MLNMSEEVQRRIQQVETDIGKIKGSIKVIENNIQHIVETLKGLSCREHKEKISCLERRQDKAVTIWATISTAIVLIAVVVGMVSHIKWW